MKKITIAWQDSPGTAQIICGFGKLIGQSITIETADKQEITGVIKEVHTKGDNGRFELTIELAEYGESLLMQVAKDIKKMGISIEALAKATRDNCPGDKEKS